jgi:hypothetical protein
VGSVMDEATVQQILDEVFGSLEPLDAQCAAVVRFLKAKGLATEEEFAPFLAQAANAASVRWLGVRVRTAALIANAMRSAEDSSQGETSTSPTSPESQAQEETSGSAEQQAQSEPTAEADEAPEDDREPPVDAKARENAEERADSENESDSPLSDPPLFKNGKGKGGDGAKSESDTSAGKQDKSVPKKSEAA